ncbi:MAG: hypothetical protein Q9170_005545 [Blastenia crenularia]
MMGQGAGASSVMHHIATTGGNAGIKPRMQKAIIQSPGFFPQPNSTQDDEMYAKFLELTGAKDVEALEKADTKVLQDANAKLVHDSKYGYFNFGPTIDYFYVPDLPAKVLAKQDEYRIPPLLVGHEKMDGLLFTPPWIRTTEALLDHVRGLFPGLPQSVLDMVASAYPIPTDLGPQASLLAVADFFDVSCLSPDSQSALTQLLLGHRNPVQLSLPHRSFAQVKEDRVPSSYYPNPPLIPPVDEKLARFFQKSIVDFVRYIDPNPEDSEAWNRYVSDNRKVMNMGSPSQLVKPDFTPSLGDDLMNSTLCEYWRSAPWYKAATSKEGSDHRFVVQNEEL